MRDLPTPDQMLEELADKAAACIDRLAPVAFDSAWDEMTRYHRFLLVINATTLVDGTPFSYAEVAGEAWHAPHHDWIKQYARLFERAAGRIPDDGHFIQVLAYAPLRLLPRRDEPMFSNNIIKAILNLGPMMMHRIEAWKTKRTTVENPVGQPAQQRLVLAGSDAKSYADVLPSLAGAWERLLQAVPSVYNWRDDESQSETQRWTALGAGWPFVWQHLCNTAHCLAVAVWNEDEEGARLFREVLVRWPETLGRRHSYSELRFRRHLFPNIFAYSWEDALMVTRSLSHEHASTPRADELFTTVVRNVHDDIILHSAALLLSWPMNNKQVSDIGAKTARALLERRGVDEDRGARFLGQPSFHSLLLDFFRMESAGERHVDGSYANDLDRLLMTMDNMTERRVVPGRIFTPSTINGREDLASALLAILAATTPEQGDDGTNFRVERLAKEVEVLPGGDRALRAIIDEIDTFLTILQESAVIGSGVELLTPGRDANSLTKRLSKILQTTKATIDEVRLLHLKNLTVSSTVLERLRRNAELALLDSLKSLSFFSDVKIGGDDRVGTDAIERASISGISKAQMVEPAMESRPVNFFEDLASTFQATVERRIWQSFAERARNQVKIELKAEQDEFWSAITPLIVRAGPRPVLMVSRVAEGRTLRRFVWRPNAGSTTLNITRKDIVEGAASYIATVEGVDVFGADFPPGVAWLFSGNLLEKVEYFSIDAPGEWVDLEFELVDELDGRLHLRYRPRMTWAETPIFELVTPDPDDLDVEDP